MGFPGGSDGKESTGNARDLGSIHGLRKFPGGGHGNPLQHSCLKNPHGQKSLVGCSPWGHTESDATEWLSSRNSMRENTMRLKIMTHTNQHQSTSWWNHRLSGKRKDKPGVSRRKRKWLINNTELSQDFSIVILYKMIVIYFRYSTKMAAMDITLSKKYS